jgi:hypothetical protein
MLRIPHCLDNWLTDGGEFGSFTHRPLSTPQKYRFLFLVLISVRGLVNPWAFCGRKGLGKLKISMASSSLETSTYRLVAQCLNKLCHRVRKSIKISWLCWKYVSITIFYFVFKRVKCWHHKNIPLHAYVQAECCFHQSSRSRGDTSKMRETLLSSP